MNTQAPLSRNQTGIEAAIGVLRQQGQMLAQANARDRGRDFLKLAAIGVVRLHVKRVQL